MVFKVHHTEQQSKLIRLTSSAIASGVGRNAACSGGHTAEKADDRFSLSRPRHERPRNRATNERSKFPSPHAIGCFKGQLADRQISEVPSSCV
jgi:hypothetical protein